MNFKNHSTKPSAKISTLQLSAYGADGFVGFKLDTLNNIIYFEGGCEGSVQIDGVIDKTVGF